MKPLLLLSLLLIPALRQTGTGEVWGEVHRANGEPAVGIRVSAMPVSQSDANAAIVLDRIAATDAAGRYRLSGITPGRYYIVAGPLSSLTYYPGVNNPAAARVLSIEPGGGVGGIDLVVEPVLVVPRNIVPLISGKVVLEGGLPLPALLPSLYVDVKQGNRRTSFGEDGRRIKGSGTYGAPAVSRQGSFRLSLPDGEYAVALITSLGDPLTADDGYYVKSMSFGSVDLLTQKLQVQGATPATIVVTLAPIPPSR